MYRAIVQQSASVAALRSGEAMLLNIFFEPYKHETVYNLIFTHHIIILQ